MHLVISILLRMDLNMDGIQLEIYGGTTVRMVGGFVILRAKRIVDSANGDGDGRRTTLARRQRNTVCISSRNSVYVQPKTMDGVTL